MMNDVFLVHYTSAKCTYLGPAVPTFTRNLIIPNELQSLQAPLLYSVHILSCFKSQMTQL